MANDLPNDFLDKEVTIKLTWRELLGLLMQDRSETQQQQVFDAIIKTLAKQQQ